MSKHHLWSIKKKERYAFVYNPLDTNLCKRACVIFGQTCLLYIKIQNKQRIFFQRPNSADVALEKPSLGRREEAELGMRCQLRHLHHLRELNGSGQAGETLRSIDCLGSTMTAGKAQGVGERARKWRALEKERNNVVFRARAAPWIDLLKPHGWFMLSGAHADGSELRQNTF